MFFYVYLIESKRGGQLYIGYTPDLVKRFEKHNRGEVRSTKPYRPWRLIFYEAYLNKSDARRRESYLKTNQGARLLKRMIKDYFYSKKN